MRSVVPSYTFHENNADQNLGNRFAARPLKQWRKQMQATNGLLSYRRAGVGMPMDRPGSTSTTTQANCQHCNNVMEIKNVVYKNSLCTSCHITRTSTSIAGTSVAGTGTGTADTYTDSAAYLQSRCITYDQKLAFNPVAGINYFSPSGFPLDPTNSPTGTQVRETDNCFITNQSLKCNTTIYKPTNSQFAQQGGVSGGSRIARLKYNTLNNYGAEYNSAKGAVGVNTGRYQTEASPSYYNKLQPQKVIYPYKTGSKTACQPRNSVCF